MKPPTNDLVGKETWSNKRRSEDLPGKTFQKVFRDEILGRY